MVASKLSVSYVSPNSQLPLVQDLDALRDASGATFPIIDGIPRFCEVENFTSSFGEQWNKFRTTQIDREGVGGEPSNKRFFVETAWKAEDLAGLDILEVGSGAGRFSRVVLDATEANLYSVDYSTAVGANWCNNSRAVDTSG